MDVDFPQTLPLGGTGSWCLSLFFWFPFLVFFFLLGFHDHPLVSPLVDSSPAFPFLLCDSLTSPSGGTGLSSSLVFGRGGSCFSAVVVTTNFDTHTHTFFSRLLQFPGFLALPRSPSTAQLVSCFHEFLRTYRSFSLFKLSAASRSSRFRVDPAKRRRFLCEDVCLIRPKATGK